MGRFAPRLGFWVMGSGFKTHNSKLKTHNSENTQ
jgi:hypothetical protein